MNAPVIPLDLLVPDELHVAAAVRMFARVPDLDVHRSQMAAGLVHAETLVDALDSADASLAAAAARALVAHVHAGRARWHELDPASRAGGAL